MGVTLTADRGSAPDGSRRAGVTLAQLSDLVERATRECVESGIDPTTVEPKTLNRIGGKISRLTIEV